MSTSTISESSDSSIPWMSGSEQRTKAYEDSLDVLELSRGQHGPPRFIRELKPQTLVEGQSLSLNVAVESVPEAQFTWYIDGIAVFNSKSDRITSHNNKSSASFHLPRKGTYVVKAENPYGQATCHAYMDIKSDFISLIFLLMFT